MLIRDDFTSDDPANNNNITTNKIIQEKSQSSLYGIMKIPILEYIFFVYVESEKTSLEPTKGTSKKLGLYSWE